MISPSINQVELSMLEVYCDSSYYENDDSYIGCTVLLNGRELHQSTTKVQNCLGSNLNCELEALDFAVTLAKIFSGNDKEIIIYNDSTEAVKFFQAKREEVEKEFLGSSVSFEYIPREKVNQVIADSLSKKFPIFYLNVPTFKVESFSRREDILSDIARNGRSIFYLEKNEELSTKKKICYRLVIRTMDKILSDELLYIVKKGGLGTQIKVGEEIRKNLSDPKVISVLKAKGIRLEDSYFLLTDESWGLRGTDNQAYSILPFSVPHRIICDEVDRSPQNLLRRASRFK
jgi:hypothetical protein